MILGCLIQNPPFFDSLLVAIQGKLNFVLGRMSPEMLFALVLNRLTENDNNLFASNYIRGFLINDN